MPCLSCTKHDDICRGQCDPETQGLPYGIAADNVLYREVRGVCVFVKDGLVWIKPTPMGDTLPYDGEMLKHLNPEAVQKVNSYIESLYESG